MKLSTKGRYAVMAMADLVLCDQGSPIILAEIADRQKISLSYLEQIFNKLKNHGLVTSVRGQNGGYFLARNPRDISVSEIFSAVGEPVSVTACSSGVSTGCMGRTGKCVTHKLWADLSQNVHSYLSNKSLADICGGGA